MFAIVVSIFVFINLTISLDNITTIENTTKSTQSEDYILCRSCGVLISSSNFIVSKASPFSQYVFEDTLFGRQKVLVQVLQSDIFFDFAVITTEHSTCISVGEWEVNESWFPGYRWKPCICPECGAYVGWVFETIEYNLIFPDKQFFGLILTNLIGESCKYTLIYIWVV